MSTGETVPTSPFPSLSLGCTADSGPIAIVSFCAMISMKFLMAAGGTVSRAVAMVMATFLNADSCQILYEAAHLRAVAKCDGAS